MSNLKKSLQVFKKAKKYIPGGVNSPVRAFASIDGNPIFVRKANGSRIYDIDGNSYIDFCMSWGAIILGHANEKIIKEIKKTINNGFNFGFTSELEIEFANLIVDAFPAIEKIRFTNSGTEAVMSSLRLARAFSKKNKIIKFDGCYHGHFDSLLVKAGSGMNFIDASSAGVPDYFIKNTISIPFNNYEILLKTIKENYKDIAAVIMEPIPGNMGLILPKEDFLVKVYKLTKEYEILLVFDEIITGFRVCFGGVQNLFNIKPDLVCLGKIIGGGFPIGAYGGRKEIMDLVSPLGNVYQAGTFAGNPVVMKAGIETLRQLKMNKKIYNEFSEKINFIKKEVNKVKSISFSNFGSMFTVFFTDKLPENFEEVKKYDSIKFKRWYLKLLKAGILLPPSQFETCFISKAHAFDDVERFAKETKRNLK